LNSKFNEFRRGNIVPAERIKNEKHWIMQILAWKWCVMISLWVGSMWVFGISAVSHVFILTAMVITVTTFETAKRSLKVFLKKGN